MINNFLLLNLTTSGAYLIRLLCTHFDATIFQKTKATLVACLKGRQSAINLCKEDGEAILMRGPCKLPAKMLKNYFLLLRYSRQSLVLYFISKPLPFVVEFSSSTLASFCPRLIIIRHFSFSRLIISRSLRRRCVLGNDNLRQVMALHSERECASKKVLEHTLRTMFFNYLKTQIHHSELTELSRVIFAQLIGTSVECLQSGFNFFN